MTKVSEKDYSEFDAAVRLYPWMYHTKELTKAMSSNAHVPRVFAEAAIKVGETLNLPKRSSHHLIKVLRLQAGDRIELFNGDGLNYHATLSGIGKTACADIHTSESNNTESPLSTCVIQGISRGDKMDTSIQKSVELGVNTIAPIYTQHSIKPLASERSIRKHDHWQQIAVAASEQCGRSVVPKVLNATTLQEFLTMELEELSSERNAENKQPEPLKVILDPTATQSLSNTIKPLAASVLVGPETGFSDEELLAAEKAGYRKIRLGARVLRTETAAPAALAVLQALYGDICR